jgi:two-component system C4-dicarboxylate transport response regulator DctD
MVVDDDEALRESLAQALDLMGYSAMSHPGAQEALADGAITECSCIIADLKMKAMDGLEFLEKMVALAAAPPVVLLTGFGDVSTAVRAMRLGAYDFLEKPVDNTVLSASVARAVERDRLRRRNRELEAELFRARLEERSSDFGIIGRSSAVQEILKRIRQYAQSFHPVLIMGETGSGKELVAAAIHRCSDRASKPFLVANVSAIPEGLVASELFGHEKGSFTGAHVRHTGYFEQASGGVLVLDEIETAPLWLQAHLLRAVENQRIMRVGGTTEFDVDVRVLATSNQSMEELVQRGAFREDLYYRLSALPIRVPPLRERAEDIPELVAHFLSQQAAKTGIGPLRVDGNVLAAFQAYPWPGNVRELQNVIARLSVTSEDGLIREWTTSRDAFSGGDHLPLQERVERFERGEIVATLKRVHGQIKPAAEALEVSRKTLYDRMKKYGLEKEDFRSAMD